jgi:hypothetical protein
MKRIFPPSKVHFVTVKIILKLKRHALIFQEELEDLGPEYLDSLEKNSRWQALWFMEMCKKDTDFC